MSARPQAMDSARNLARRRWSTARLVLLAGSVIRDEATAHSDLDMVVLFDALPHARRESFFFDGWPVEAFLHDEETLSHFFAEVDGASGFPALPRMVMEGRIVAGDEGLAEIVKERACAILERGPTPLAAERIDRIRYEVTDLVDDVRSPRNRAELHAAGARLHEILADAWFRLRGVWSAKGKTIPRRMLRENPAFAARWEGAFAALWARDDPAAVVALAEEILSPHGGFLFEGYALDAPPTWRKKTVREEG